MQLYPLTFEPILKERVWGGRKLADLYRKNLSGASPVGESWEISDRPEAVSIVANGPLAGRDLHWLIEHFGKELIGNTRLYGERFPLLIKILDCRERLSLQVHPPGDKAAALGGEPKTEMWYVAEATPGAELYVGLKRGCAREEFVTKIRAGTVESCFHKVKVQTGDAMFLPSGRVHALGAGLVIFEIQQNSDTTYRVFDWNRMGLDGKPRPLHVEQSLASIDFSDFEPEPIRASPGERRVTLVSDPLFAVELIRFTPDDSLSLEAGKMQILGVTSGEVRVQASAGDLVLSAGQFCLVPACLEAVVVRAEAAATSLRVEAAEQEPV